jgi:formylglycine-generating enzyme required for sulfatase activity
MSSLRTAWAILFVGGVAGAAFYAMSPRTTATTLAAAPLRAGPDPNRAAGQFIINSIGMRLLLIPSGEYMMGNAESAKSLSRDFPAYDSERISKLIDEKPLHKVHITKPFHLGDHEVTIDQFRQFTEEAHYQAESERDGTGGWGYNVKIAYFEGRDPKYSWRDPGFPQDATHPVWSRLHILRHELHGHDAH